MAQDKEMNVAFEGAAFGDLNMEIDWESYTTNAAFTSINDSMSGSLGTTTTVSPKDIFNDPLASAPPSTAFTNLTSPSINESPFIGDSYDTSPMFQHDGDMSSADWYPLFPAVEDKPAAAAIQRSASDQSIAKSPSSGNNSPQDLALDVGSGRRKSNENSPAVANHSSTSGVTKSRRRKGPLPPITIQDPSDRVALKRARNTLAARESRQRKYEHVMELEKRIAELEDERKSAAEEAEKWRSIALGLGYPPS